MTTTRTHTPAQIDAIFATPNLGLTLLALPVIEHGPHGNLVIETENMRVWVSPLARHHGADFDHEATIEHNHHGHWKPFGS